MLKKELTIVGVGLQIEFLKLNTSFVIIYIIYAGTLMSSWI